MDKNIMENLVESCGSIETAQEFMCYENIAKSITKFVNFGVDGKLVSDEIKESREADVRPLVDNLFDRVTYVPQFSMASRSTLVELGLHTGHLVTENPMENWYTDAPYGTPTQVYLYYTAPEELVTNIPDYLKEKRSNILESLNSKVR